MSTTMHVPPALHAERLAGAVNAARRSVRRAALAVDLTVEGGGDVHRCIEDVVRAGTALEQAEQAYAAVTK